MSDVLAYAPLLRDRLRSWEEAAPAELLERLRSDSMATRTETAKTITSRTANRRAAALALVECLSWRPERPRTGRLEMMRWNTAVRALVNAAGAALARIGAPAVPIFVAIAASPDKPFAAKCVSLRDVRDPAAADSLVTCLGSANSLIRRYAAQALGAIGPGAAVEALGSALRDPAEDVRQAAAEALRKIGGEAALGQLVDGLLDADEGARTASRELGKVKDTNVIEFLIAALEHESGLVAEQAAQSLGRMGASAAVESLLKVAIHPWMPAAAAALAALKSIDPDWQNSASTQAAVPGFAEAVRHPDPAVRRNAATVLAKLKQASTAQDLVARLGEEPDASVREAIALALGAVGRDDAVDPLLEALASETDPAVAIRMVEALGELGDADAVEPLTALIEPEDKPSGRLVAAVVRALGDLGDERAIPALIDVMTAERFNLPAARAAVKALGRIGGDEAVAALRAVQQGHWSDNTRGAGFVARDAKEALAGQPVGAVDTGSS